MVIIHGEQWQIQVVMYPLPHGFEVIRSARLIRVQWMADSEAFAARVAAAVARAHCSIRIVGAVD